MRPTLRLPFLFILSLSIAIVTVGCASIPQTHYYVLERGEHISPTSLTHFSHNPASQQGLEIGVKTFLVNPPYDQDRIVYRRSGGSTEIGFYAYHRWAAPLSRMLPNVVAEGFRGTPGIASVEPALPGRVYGAHLDGRVLSFEEIDTPEGYKAYLRLTLTLRLKDGTLVWSDTLVGEATTQTRTVSAVVGRMRTALAAALDEGRVGLASALANLAEAR